MVTIEDHALSEVNKVGVETLRRMVSVDNYNRWIYRLIEPYLGETVLEVGCGLGNMTAFLADNRKVVCLDILPAAITHVSQQFARCRNVRPVLGDITRPEAVDTLRSSYCFDTSSPVTFFDTVVCLNVLEHILEDAVALRNMQAVLASNGTVVLFVPAGRYMYGTLDRALGHYRRYDRSQLEALVANSGFQVLKLRYVNLLGVPGWWVNSRVLRRRLLSRSQLRLFNWLAPAGIVVEEALHRLVDLPFGQSLLCVARKSAVLAA